MLNISDILGVEELKSVHKIATCLHFLPRLLNICNVMVALPNIGGALCSTPQSLADAHYLTVPCSNAAKTRNPLKLAGVTQTTRQISAVSGPMFTIL